MSTVTLHLRRDYVGGLTEFVSEAEKKYPKIDIIAAMESCTARNWKVLKGTVVNDLSVPLFADLAESLEKAIIHYGPKNSFAT